MIPMHRMGLRIRRAERLASISLLFPLIAAFISIAGLVTRIAEWEVMVVIFVLTLITLLVTYLSIKALEAGGFSSFLKITLVALPLQMIFGLVVGGILLLKARTLVKDMLRSRRPKTVASEKDISEKGVPSELAAQS